MPITREELDAYIGRLGENDPSLTSLDLSNRGLTDRDASEILRALEHNNTLLSLDLSLNSLFDVKHDEDSYGELSCSISRMLSYNERLVSLNLRHTGMGNFAVDVGTAPLVGYMGWGACYGTNRTLTSLDLGANNVDNEGAKTIAARLEVNRTLTTVNLDGNRVSPEGQHFLRAIEEAVERNIRLYNSPAAQKERKRVQWEKDHPEEVRRREDAIQRKAHKREEARQKEAEKEKIRIQKRLQWEKDHPEDVRKQEEARQKRAEKERLKLEENRKKHEEKVEKERQKYEEKARKKREHDVTNPKQTEKWLLGHLNSEGRVQYWLSEPLDLIGKLEYRLREKIRIQKGLQREADDQMGYASAVGRAAASEESESIDSHFAILVAKLKANTPSLTAVRIGDMPSYFKLAMDIQAVIEALPLNRTLTWLDFSGCCYEKAEDNIRALYRLIETNQAPILTTLKLRNYVGVVYFQELVRAIESNVTLASIDLVGNGIGFYRGDENMRLLAESLKINDTLISIDLSNNRIDDRGLGYLAAAMEVNHTILFLELDGDQSFGPESEGYLKTILACIERNKSQYIKNFPLHAALLFQDVSSEFEAKALKSHVRDSAGRTTSQIREIRRALQIDFVSDTYEWDNCLISHRREVGDSTTGLARLLATCGLFATRAVDTGMAAEAAPAPLASEREFSPAP